MKNVEKENIIKNIIVGSIIILLYPAINDYLAASGLAQEKASAGDILVAISIIAVIACFGAFSFSYEKTDMASTFQRYLGHFTTGLLMLIIGISMVFTSILISFVIGHFIIIDITLALLYLACLCYDFWDIQKSIT